MMCEDMVLTNRMLLRLHLFRLDCDAVGNGEAPRFTAAKDREKERPCLELRQLSCGRKGYGARN